MLQNIRDNAQGTIAKIIVAVIAITFALFGVESIVGGMQGEPEVAVVDGEEITESQYARAVEQRRRQILSQMGPQADASAIDENLLRRAVLEGLIEEQVLLNAADNKKLVISNALIDQYIRSMPAFQQNGRFSQEAYVATLRGAGILPLEFRQSITRELLLQQDREAIRQTAFVTDSELSRLIGLDRQTRDFAYLTIPTEQFRSQVEVTDEEIQEYYQANQDAFRLPERVALEYIELDRAALADEVKVTEQDLKVRYEQAIAELQRQEERKAAHILIEVGEDQNREEALARINQIQEELQAGADFAELAKKYSQDLGSANDGGDLGYVTPGIFVPEFDQALFEMRPGEVSEPVLTEFGYHLIKLEDVREQEAPTYEEMKEQLTATVRMEKAQALFEEKARLLEDVSYTAPDLEEPASVLKVEVKESPVFSREGGEGLFANPRLVNVAFSDEVLNGENSSPLDIGDGKKLVVRLKQHFEPSVEPLEAVEQEIRERLVAEKAQEKAAELGAQLVAAYEQGASFEELAKQANQTWQTVDQAQRSEPSVNPDVLAEVFAMPRPQAGESGASEVVVQWFKIGLDQYVLVALKSVQDGSLESFSEAERKAIEDILVQSGGAREYLLKSQLLHQQADIKRT